MHSNIMDKNSVIFKEHGRAVAYYVSNGIVANVAHKQIIQSIEHLYTELHLTQDYTTGLAHYLGTYCLGYFDEYRQYTDQRSFFIEELKKALELAMQAQNKIQEITSEEEGNAHTISDIPESSAPIVLPTTSESADEQKIVHFPPHEIAASNHEHSDHQAVAMTSLPPTPAEAIAIVDSLQRDIGTHRAQTKIIQSIAGIIDVYKMSTKVIQMLIGVQLTSDMLENTSLLIRRFLELMPEFLAQAEKMAKEKESNGIDAQHAGHTIALAAVNTEKNNPHVVQRYPNTTGIKHIALPNRLSYRSSNEVQLSQSYSVSPSPSPSSASQKKIAWYQYLIPSLFRSKDPDQGDNLSTFDKEGIYRLPSPTPGDSSTKTKSAIRCNIQ